jgi:hypothetical protein
MARILIKEFLEMDWLRRPERVCIVNLALSNVKNFRLTRFQAGS